LRLWEIDWQVIHNSSALESRWRPGAEKYFTTTPARATANLVWICGKILRNSRPMNPLIKLLLEGGSLNTAQMAQVLNLSEAEVNRQLDALKKDGMLLGFRPVLNLADEDSGVVRAVIEVRITPERGGGFNRLAERISKFDEVESCYLMSGGYDLLVFVNGASLQRVAAFVSEKLSTLEGVLSTATHFMLRSYKEQGFMLDVKTEETERLKVTP
jgi:DNA-binding Lrp family transcriptional regulator